MDRFTQYAVAASKMAVEDANLRLQKKLDFVLASGLVQESEEWKHTKHNSECF